MRWKGDFSPCDENNWTPELRAAVKYDQHAAQEVDNLVVSFASVLGLFLRGLCIDDGHADGAAAAFAYIALSALACLRPGALPLCDPQHGIPRQLPQPAHVQLQPA